MPDFVDNTAGYSEVTGTADYLMSTTGTGKHLRPDQALTDGQEVAYYCVHSDTGIAGFESGVATWDETANTLVVVSITNSSNGGGKISWGAGDKIVYIVANAAMLASSGGNRVDTVADMVAYAGADVGDYIQVQSYTATNNSGILTFVAVAPATGTADGGSYINGVGVQWKQIFGPEVSAESFGVGSSTPDDDAGRLQKAINYVSAQGGGVVKLNNDCSLSGAVTVKTGVTLSGGLEFPGSWKVDQEFGSKILVVGNVNPFVLEKGASLTGVIIQKSDALYPQTRVQSASWTNTAITCNGAGTAVRNCYIVGFLRAADYGQSAAVARVTMENVFIDCLNGVRINNSVDVDRLQNVHIWPFLSTGSAETHRDGTGIELVAPGSWARLDSCFVFGMDTGYVFDGTTDISMDNCAVDANSTTDAWVGVSIVGDAKWTKISNSNFGGTYAEAIRINTSATAAQNTVQISCCKAGGGDALKQINIISAGRVIIDGCVITGGEVGIEIAADMGVVTTVSGTQLTNQTVAPIRNSAAGYTTNTLLYDNSNSITWSGTVQTWLNAPDQIVTRASNTNLYIPPNYAYVKITGTTTINAIYASVPGRHITFEIVSGLSFNNSGSIKTRTGATTAYAAGDRVTYVCTGSQYYEVAKI